MQPMTGIELLRKVLASETQKHLQSIMISRERETLNIIAAKDAGASNYIVKPFFGDTLKAKLVSITASAA